MQRQDREGPCWTNRVLAKTQVQMCIQDKWGKGLHTHAVLQGLIAERTGSGRRFRHRRGKRVLYLNSVCRSGCYEDRVCKFLCRFSKGTSEPDIGVHDPP